MSSVYEVSYLLLPTLALEQVPGEVASIKEALSSGGEVISSEDPVLIDLAYPMTKVVQTVRHKASTGYFGWVKFETDAEGVEKAKKTLDENESILRYLIIKTVRENTLLHGKMMLKKESAKTEEPEEKTAEASPAEELSSPEEIDKSIDDLVIS